MIDAAANDDRYVPLDELLARPAIRALRVLRRCDWLSAGEIGDILGLPTEGSSTSPQSPERNRLSSALGTMKRRGQVEHRRTQAIATRGLVHEYRITARGRTDLARALSGIGTWRLP